MTLVVDYTHVHRDVTGIERVSLSLFSCKKMNLSVEYIRAKSKVSMILGQWFSLPLRAVLDKDATFICPGFPPSILLTLVARKRLYIYVHDLFLMTRKSNLNSTAKYYLRPSFKYAVSCGEYYLVNSQYTFDELRRYCSRDAKIWLLRPIVENIFNLPMPNSFKKGNSSLRVVSIGTIEPRKNYLYGAAICKKLSCALGCPVEFHIIGRIGWGVDVDTLSSDPSVFLHGYCDSETVRSLVMRADLFLSTSLDEGLGLPLLEVQHGGLLVVATDIPAYREVLKDSGCLIPFGQIENAVRKIERIVIEDDWREVQKELAIANVNAWNIAAKEDFEFFLDRLNIKN